MTKKKGIVTKWIITIVLFLFGIVCIYPFLFTVSSAFKPTGDVLSTPLQLIPEHFTLQNIKALFSNQFYDFNRWYLNTIVVTVTTLVLKFFIITLTAYGFSKVKFPGRDKIFLVLLAGLMIPSDVMIMPRYILFKELGILNTMWSLVLPATVDVYFVFMLRQAFIAIPESISEAAKIDGCSHFTIYRRIILPLGKSSIATMLLFSFTWVWNDYMGPYLYISDVNKQMLSVGIKLFAAGQAQDYGAQMAATTFVLLPIIAAFFLCQRYFVEGITAGAVKG